MSQPMSTTAVSAADSSKGSRVEARQSDRAKKHTTAGIRGSSPTQLLNKRSPGYPGGSNGTLIFQAAMVGCINQGGYLLYKVPSVVAPDI